VKFILVVIHSIGLVSGITFDDLAACKAAEKEFHKKTRDTMSFGTFCVAQGTQHE